MRIRIIYKTLSNLQSDWIRPLVDPVFEFVEYSAQDRYTNRDVYYNSSLTPDPESEQFELVLFDNLSEHVIVNTTRGLLLQSPVWWWYNVSLWYQYRGYDQYQPQRTHEYRALMPMNNPRAHRNKMIRALKPVLDKMIWSYVATGRCLPGDELDNSAIEMYYLLLNFRSQWYDQTDFSVVAETTVTDPVPFLTEKTFKPLAFWHPFLIVAVPGHLEAVRALGFETFGNMFDESYDTMTNVDQRIQCIADQVIDYVPGNYNQETWQKLEHNRNLFFSADISTRMRREVIEPIIKYATSANI